MTRNLTQLIKDTTNKQAAEIARLQKLNAQLLEALSIAANTLDLLADNPQDVRYRNAATRVADDTRAAIAAAQEEKSNEPQTSA